ncbi:hypothetical protein GUJ93_ZPchr0013g35843 [Zizania palustris]|uniref:FAS1 domain-containing protein n=1 Tax=Zizania palustris TaxID=103762 RepID=A0A8J5X3T5_ZIZPA|nr:hypothetical protein GUJ93_ZPchr0013g35843 [Zizania palustris]
MAGTVALKIWHARAAVAGARWGKSRVHHRELSGARRGSQIRHVRLCNVVSTRGRWRPHRRALVVNMTAMRKRRLFLLRPRLLRQRHLHAAVAGAFAVTLLFLALVILSTSPSSSPPPSSRDDIVGTVARRRSSSPPPSARCGSTTTTSLGEFGDMMMSMLPRNLAFTVFVPSPESFRRVLKLRPNDSLAEGKADRAYAVVSRVLGFSAVPRRLRAADVPLRRQAVPVLESVSGLRISAWRDADGALVVNGVPSECVDVVKDRTITVHVMAGVLMDPEFERSFSS